MAQKSALLDEVEAENGKVAVVARRHGISESLLYNWRSAWKSSRLCGERAGAGGLRSAGCIGRSKRQRRPLLAPPTPEQPQPPQASEAAAGMIEIALPNGVRICVDALGEREGIVAGPARDEGRAVISLAPGTKVFLACRPVDLRNGFDGLAAKAQQMIGADPFSGHLFIFRGKARRLF